LNAPPRAAVGPLTPCFPRLFSATSRMPRLVCSPAWPMNDGREHSRGRPFAKCSSSCRRPTGRSLRALAEVREPARRCRPRDECRFAERMAIGDLAQDGSHERPDLPPTLQAMTGTSPLQYMKAVRLIRARQTPRGRLVRRRTRRGLRKRDAVQPEYRSVLRLAAVALACSAARTFATSCVDPAAIPASPRSHRPAAHVAAGLVPAGPASEERYGIPCRWGCVVARRSLLCSTTRRAVLRAWVREAQSETSERDSASIEFVCFRVVVVPRGGIDTDTGIFSPGITTRRPAISRSVSSHRRTRVAHQ